MPTTPQSGRSDSGSEDVGVCPVVVAELKLRDVQRQILLGHFVEGAHHPAFELAPKALDGVGVNCANNILVLGVIHHAVTGFVLPTPRVAHPVIGREKRNAIRDRLVDEAGEGNAVGAVNHTAENVTATLNRSGNDHLPAAFVSPLLVVMAVLVLPANVGLIHFDETDELVERLVSHSRSHAVAHRPRGAIRTRPDHPMDLEGRDSLLRDHHQENDLEPRLERIVGVLEDRPDEYREAVAGRRALMALEVVRLGEGIDLFATAPSALNPVRPAAANEVVPARFLGGELRFQLGQRHLFRELLSHWNPLVKYRERKVA